MKALYQRCGPVSVLTGYVSANGHKTRHQSEGIVPRGDGCSFVQLKQKPDDYINVTIELDDMDITSAETKATYDEIKKYVAEHNAGMKVSNLYISQVKRKCGIEVGKNLRVATRRMDCLQGNSTTAATGDVK